MTLIQAKPFPFGDHVPYLGDLERIAITTGSAVLFLENSQGTSKRPEFVIDIRHNSAPSPTTSPLWRLQRWLFIHQTTRQSGRPHCWFFYRVNRSSRDQAISAPFDFFGNRAFGAESHQTPLLVGSRDEPREVAKFGSQLHTVCEFNFC
ncbi:hypothetical protein QO002_006277 [Pararhizobium capsulatum DSM 1112]|uniref:Uncharacterized protein n=1 Tax=Pararhizobium capsulatum DSM 1112 TaxID=1121113 RepID=A0ABU0C0Q7_9HYPH|nr:hypothetical protein [Pararhizobium capsulatum]MDQ0324070.1 hypothetical protein [Pararhizobium capsulatum DSM 1112]